MNLKKQRILVTGGSGFLGSFLIKKLKKLGVSEKSISSPNSKDIDFRKFNDCIRATKNADLVIHLAARVGGIGFNLDNPATAFYDNAAMAINLIEASRINKVGKFVGIGSVCSYPKIVSVPFKEEDLWNGYPEETNAPYGLAKKMMLVQSQAYNKQYGLNAIHLLLTNLYGPNENNLDPKNSHVVVALIKKFVEAKKNNAKFVEIWGTGKITREFLYVEDAAEGILMAAQRYDKPEPINLGNGKEISIASLASTISKLVGYKGTLRWDPSKPDGQPRRCLNTDRAYKEFGFKAKTDIKKGLKTMIEWYSNNS